MVSSRGGLYGFVRPGRGERWGRCGGGRMGWKVVTTAEFPGWDISFVEYVFAKSRQRKGKGKGKEKLFHLFGNGGAYTWRVCVDGQAFGYRGVSPCFFFFLDRGG